MFYLNATAILLVSFKSLCLQESENPIVHFCCRPAIWLSAKYI